MKRRIYISQDSGEITFSPAPPGQLDQEPEGWMDELEGLLTIDNEELVAEYIQANNEEYRLFKLVIDEAEKEKYKPQHKPVKK